MHAVSSNLDKVSSCTSIRPWELMDAADTMPRLVQSFERDGSDAAALLREFMRHIARVARPYPDAYFVLGQKNEDAVDDLGNRAFSSCASIQKGRFPFSGRTPFASFVQEAFDGRTIRYHSFYAKLSITRELLRDDYAFNLRRNPVLRWRADLYANIGDVVKTHCTAIAQGRGLPPKWTQQVSPLQMIQPVEVAIAKVRDLETDVLHEQIVEALRVAGPQTQSRLTHIIESAIGCPIAEEAEVEIVHEDTADRLTVRQAVAEAWTMLEDTDRALLIALAKGSSYDELIGANPSLNNKVAISRAVSRVGSQFLAVVTEAVGGTASATATPRALIEPILTVLAELYPHDFA